MPWMMIRQAKAEDLQAIYAYLRTMPPVKNQVSDPTPPSPPPVCTGHRPGHAGQVTGGEHRPADRD